MQRENLFKNQKLLIVGLPPKDVASIRRRLQLLGAKKIAFALEAQKAARVLKKSPFDAVVNIASNSESAPFQPLPGQDKSSVWVIRDAGDKKIDKLWDTLREKLEVLLESAATAPTRKLQRTATRLVATLTLTSARTVVQGTVVNLSDGGMCVNTKAAALREGDILTFSLEDEAARHVVVGHGRVRWYRAETALGDQWTCGVKFAPLSARYQQNLRSIISDHP